MRAPAWLRLGRPKPHPTKPNTVTITATVEPFLEALRQAALSFSQASEAAAQFGRTVRAAYTPTVDTAQVERDRGLPVYRTRSAHPMNQALADHLRRRRWETELAITRAETSWYVRGGLAPEYATPEARDAQVRALAVLMDPPVAARCAAAFLRGWVEHRAETSGECLCWPTPPHMWTTHYGAVEPGSAIERNPDCPAHYLGARP